MPVSLSLEDSELLSFYSSQSLAHLSCLADSIDGLFASVQGNQPPRVFVARGKSLIVTAHKLVFIGDTLSRLLSSPDLRAKVRNTETCVSVPLYSTPSACYTARLSLSLSFFLLVKLHTKYSP